jgi:serine/threonine protein phosphatase PrpC
VLIIDDKYYSANVGDSRATIVKFHENKKLWSCMPLSLDHKPSEKDEKKRI